MRLLTSKNKGSTGVAIPLFVILLVGLMVMFIPSQLNFYQYFMLKGEMQHVVNNAVMNAIAQEINVEEFRDRILSSNETLVDLAIVKETFVKELQDQLEFKALSKLGYDDVIIVTGITEAGGVTAMQGIHLDLLDIKDKKILYIFVNNLQTGSAKDKYHFEGEEAMYFYLKADLIISPRPFYYNTKQAQQDLVDNKITALRYEKNVFTNLGYNLEHGNLGIISVGSASRVYFRER